MSWITENPIPLFILGLLAQVILGIALWQTGRAWLLLVMIGLAIGSATLLVVERLIESPTEEVARTLDELAAALESNQPDAVVAFLAPDNAALIADARQQLKRVEIQEATVAGDLRVAFPPDPDSADETATASFNGRIKAKFFKDTSPYDQIIQRFKLYLRKQDGKWLITGYETNRR